MCLGCSCVCGCVSECCACASRMCFDVGCGCVSSMACVSRMECVSRMITCLWVSESMLVRSFVRSLVRSFFSFVRFFFVKWFASL